MQTQPRSVLYIDDDPGLRRLVEKLLSRQGHEVVTCSSGTEGIEAARGRPFDVIAVDHYMPGLDGLQTLAALRQLPSCPPVIYVTGSEESRIAVAALKAGAYEYVVKTAGDDFVHLLEQAFTLALARVRLEGEKSAAEDALRTANARLQTLLREVNHRVANSLQLVSAMVSMQARHLSDGAAKDALDDTQRRIQAIAKVHRRLYTSDDVESVDMDEYLAAIIAELEETWSRPEAPRPIKLAADSVKIATDKAVSLGIIVTELVSNSCKYAYDEGQPGEIRVEFGRQGDRQYFLTVEDDGRGLCAGAVPQGTGLGSKLIAAMAQSLSSRLAYDDEHRGCRVTLAGSL